MSFDIKFDYRFDDLGFFTLERKEVLEAAGQVWSAYIQDEFSDVTISDAIEVPIDSVAEDADGNFYFKSTNKTTVIEEPIDDLLIFAYSAEMPEAVTTLANAGPFGSYPIGSDLDERYNGDDFQPWLGRVLFDRNADFYFDDTPLTDDVPEGQSDFFSVALHEIGHILGIGAAPVFESLTNENNMFEGESSMALNGGEAILLHEDSQHVDEDLDLHEEDALLEPTATEGEKTLISDLDLALLSDIGYEINTATAVWKANPIYRFYNSVSKGHFFTASEAERDNILANPEWDFSDEGVGFYGSQIEQDDLLPIYRFYNSVSKGHFFTASEAERDNILANPEWGFSDEGVGFYAYEQAAGIADDIYRFYNPASQGHFFTASEAERDTILANPEWGFYDEGVGFEAYL